MIEGTFELGPADGTLSIRTARTGAAAKAGHDLVIEVAAWEATLALAANPAASSVALNADSSSLLVREGTGGISELDDADRASILATIDDEVLLRRPIEFRSTAVAGEGDGPLHVSGELTLIGNTRPCSFDVVLDADGRITATAVVRQSDWGIKPYSTLFGALRVADEVEIALATGPLAPG
jgi:hypothetical protein